MPDDRIASRGLIEKGADAELLREVIGFAASLGGAAARRGRSRSVATLVWLGASARRSGWSGATATPRATGRREPGRSSRASPSCALDGLPAAPPPTIGCSACCRNMGSYFPGFLEPRRAADKPLTAETYVQGISTRSVDERVKAPSRGPLALSLPGIGSKTSWPSIGCLASPRARSRSCARRPSSGSRPS
jgi:hypothetical protein